MRTLRIPVPRLNAPQPAVPERRDPAPSRWSYRMQRLWLTPLFRVLFRFGLPVLGVALVAAIYLASADRRAALVSAYDEFKTQFQNRPEFIVSLISVEGASADLSDAIRARMALKLPLSSFDIDLNAAREKIEALDAVARAELRVRTGGTLEVAITERQPALIWRLDDQTLQMIDATGHRVAGLAERQDRPDLPLVAGEGADLAAADAMQIIAAVAPIVPRLRGLVRIGDRRWDLVLDRDQRILLPADQPVRAIERLLALDKAENLLARDIQTVDLRNGDHPVIRLGRHAFAEIRRARGIEVPENDI